MVTAHLQGGLGNQMFQIAAATSLAIDNNDIACFDLSKHKIGLQGKNAITYQDNIFRNVINKPIDSFVIYQEKRFNFNKINYINGINLFGYFQSEKYFNENKEYIIDMFSPKKELSNKYSEKINTFNKSNKETVSLHVRRGDYLLFKDIHPFIGLNYIQSALSLFNDCLILVFSDDILWCKENIKSKNNEIVFLDDTNNDYDDIYLMSSCDNHILSNSSFSWWGSYLNKNKNKKIVAPKNWFGKSFTDDFSDIYTNNMIIL